MVFPSGIGTVLELDQLVVRWKSALGEYGVILSGVRIEVEDPVGDVGMDLEMSYVWGAGKVPADSRPDISA
jgi:hypothetical protein